MSTCFDRVVGLSSRDCDCFTDGRPNGGAEVTKNLRIWEYQPFTCPDTPPDPYTLSTNYDLPDDISRDVQLFASGQILAPGVDFNKTGTRELTVAVPVPGLYQLWYNSQQMVVESVPAYSTSDSGLYISDLMPEEEVVGLEKCDQTVWTIFEKARADAIREFKTNFNLAVMARHKLRYQTFSGFVGETRTHGYLDSTKQYAGVHARCASIKSGYVKITRIASMFQATGTIALTIYDQQGYVITPQFNVSTLAGKSIVTDLNITLPMVGDFEADRQDYFIVFEYDEANRPMLNKVNCGCRDLIIPQRNVNTFYGREDLRGPNAWHNFIMLGGWEGDSVSDFSDAPDQVSEYFNGLAFHFEIGCDMNDSLCGMVEGFGANPFAMGVATCIQRKAASIIARKRIGSSIPNRNTTVNKDGLSKLVAQWEGEYNETVQYLASNLPDGSSDCIVCKPRITTRGILT